MKNLYLSLLGVCLISTIVFGQNRYKYPRGIIEGEDIELKTIPQKAPLTRNFYVNVTKSASIKNYAPTPQSQGNYGTCTGWAVAYAARTILEAQHQGWSDKSTITKNAFSPTFQYRLANPSSASCKGAAISKAIQSLYTTGSVPMNSFFLNKVDNVMCPSYPMQSYNYTIAKKYKIEEYTALWENDYSDNQSKVNRVKKSISEKKPIIIAMICPNSFDDVGKDGLWRPTENPYDKINGRQHGRHAMCVVGYDDSKYGGAFEIQNSWGTTWGDNGYVWIKYSDFSRFVYQAFELVQLPKPKPQMPLLAGSLRLYDMDDNVNLKVNLAAKERNWTVVNPPLPSPNTTANYTYKVVPTLLSGSKMRMYLKSEQPAFVYMLGTGSVDKSVNKLFPVDGISPAMNYSSSEVALPSEKHFFQMDNTEGKSYIIVIFSKEKLDINTIKSTIDNSKGNVSQRVRAAIGNKLIDPKHILLDKNEISFKVEQNHTTQKTFAMIIEFNQVNR